MNDKSKAAIKAIDDMKTNESLDVDSWSKCMVELAHNFIRDGELDDCIQTLGRVSPEYFRDKQVQHMAEDETYRNNVFYLTYKLIQFGIVDVGYNIEHTQRWGEA